QAFAALLVLDRHVLGIEPGLLEGVIRAKRPERLPVLRTRDEVRAVLGHLDGVPRWVALRWYGAGLRMLDALRRRIQDVDFARRALLLRHGPGGRARRPRGPAAARAELLAHRDGMRPRFEKDRADRGGVSLPEALDVQDPAAPCEGAWDDVFPARPRGIDP